MSTTKRIAFGAAATWVSRMVTIVLGFVLLPMLLGHLPKEEVGIWLLLGQSWAVLGILDLGFGVTLTRRIALAKGKSGGSPDTELTPESRAEIADLVASGSRIYRFMAAGVFVVSFSLGFFYLRNLELHELSHTTVWVAWTILCACQALTVWGSVWVCLVQGMGYVGWDALLATVINGIMLLLQIFAVFLGGGVIALALIATAGALAQRVVTRRFTYRSKPELFAVRGAWNPEVLRGGAALAIRAWLSSLGTVLVFHTDGFFIASAAGAENIPAFRAAFLVVLNMHIIASVFAQSSSVFISQLWQAGQHDEVRRIFQRNLRIGLCVMLCGGAAVLAAGESLFKVWLGPSNYVGSGIMSLFVLLFVLEQQSFIISTSCRATDHEPFAGWMMAGGFIKMLLAFFLIKHLGLFGLALATLVAQLLTAHWFVVWRGLQRLQFGFRRYLLAVVMPLSMVTLAALAMAALGGYLSRNCSDWVRLLGVFSGAGAVLFVALWFLAMDDGQRTRILGWISVRKANRAISFL